ncbi:MAG: alpha-glucan family phosphorylase [Spirochaetes bacterium]|nr:alpha-glucan family phosphorylase [Spirochaetota bacterium]
MPTIKKYLVSSSVPKELAPLKEITQNYWWSWDLGAVNLLRRIDRDVWEKQLHNPTKTLGSVAQQTLANLVGDDAFMTELGRVHADFKEYMSRPAWYDSFRDTNSRFTIAYFSFEYGIHESLPIYSGGLGVLSGDHLKSASDLGIPLVAMGLLYSRGYFRQYLNADGWQQEYDIENDFYNLPLEICCDANKNQLKIDIDLPGRKVWALIWKAKIGRVDLYFLDTNIEDNSPEDRHITSQLYGGDREMRIKQEILLGVGGVRAFKKLGIEPTVYHMNEGHSAFLTIERMRMYVQEKNLSLFDAAQIVYATSVFTTHTPVPAGNDSFTSALMHKYFTEYVERFGLKIDRFLRWGRQNPDDVNENFCMTVLALNCSAFANGVSKLHGVVSRHMWQRVWPDVPVDELPIAHITNGIHTESWISFEMQGLYDRYLSPKWRTDPVNWEHWRRIEQIPDAEIWRIHERRKERLISFVRERVKEQMRQKGYPQSEIEGADSILDTESLTIGFSRRFATYKRGSLIFHDLERIKKILANKECPVQIIFAGKAHPHDNEGKEIIRYLSQIARRDEFRNHVVFIEDYDINVARYLVQGVDIWLNNPRRPEEASGTSGMKGPVNGVINLSILDGWWDEAYNGENGWAIGRGEEYTEYKYQDDVESRALYNVLEKDIIPLFYDRTHGEIPRGWVKKMKSSIMSVCPVFNTNRMVQDYTRMFYQPAHRKAMRMAENNFEHTKKLAQWKDGIQHAWDNVRIESVSAESPEKIEVGMSFAVEAVVALGSIAADSVKVEIYNGVLNRQGEITKGTAIPMAFSREAGKGKYVFRGEIPCSITGQNGYAIRVFPYHEDISYKFEMKLIKWS